MALRRSRSSINRNRPRVIPTCLIVLGALILCLVLPGRWWVGAALGEGGKALKIVRITPSGADVPAGRQIVFEFDRPVVPLGRMGRSAAEIPIVTDPPLSCQWRWISSSSLACRLDEQHAMAPSTRYTVRVEPGIRAEDGSVLGEPVVHSFLTQRARITSANFDHWLSPVSPRFRVRFNQPVQKDSIEAHLYFQAEGEGRVASKAVEDTSYAKISPPGTVWLVSPAKGLAQDRDCDIAVEPGVVSTLGPESGAENKKLATFRTMPPFRFLGVQCKELGGAEVFLSPGAPDGARCNPADEVALVFSSPVKDSELKKKLHTTSTAKGAKGWRDLWSDYDYSRLSQVHKKGQVYTNVLETAAIAPYAYYRIRANAGNITDEFGRRLAKEVNMRFGTDHRPPELYLFKNMSVLEKGLDTDLPVLATNLDEIELKYETLTAAGKLPVRTQVLPVPKAPDVIQALPLGVRKMVPAESGMAWGGISPRPAFPEKEYRPRWFFAQITPFDVHVKLGHYNTLVWVSDLASGQPVPGVDVRIQKDFRKYLNTNPETLSEARTGEDGVAVLDGTSKVDPGLKLSQNSKPDAPGLFVMCRKGGDLALLPIGYDFQVDAEGSNHQYIPSWSRKRHGHLRAWGATAQGIYKVGDTVDYKIYVRDQANRRFVQPPHGDYLLKVIDPASKVVYQRENIKLSEFGAFDGKFQIPGNGAVGYYRFRLESDFTNLALEPMEVLVSDFTPSPFRVTTELNGKLFGVGEQVNVSATARLHSGGPYGGAETRVTAVVESQPFHPANPMARGFQFDVLKMEDDEDRTPPGVQTLFETRGKLDDNGNFETRFTVAETPVLYGRMSVETTVRDDRGKSVANRAGADYYGRDRYVGLYQEDWLLTQDRPAGIKFLVVDQHGNAVPGTKTRILVERLETKAARVKGAGDAYPTQYSKEWIKVQEFDLTSAENPSTFEFTPKQPGTIRFVASVDDTKGRVHQTAMRRWVTGKGHVLWEAPEGNFLNVYPEKEQYRVGETAKFLVQNPFPGARALIGVERYGSMDHWVKTLESSAEVVEVPVLPDYLPGFYLSVTVMSPRVEKPLGPGGEDLGKPAFRMGYAKIEVKDKYKEISVQCRSDKQTYKPRETVELEFEAHPKNIGPKESPPPIELAVAVLDEAVFDLLKQKSQAFDPYQGFYRLEDLDLQNYNLIMQLVGREKLEKKGASPAASAGFDLSMRSVFKFVSYWNPSVRVDAHGKAKVRFELPDNLTGWRVLAMAVTPEDRMGLGEAVFKVNQSTELRPVMPNQVIEGDTFEAGFSVMNRTGEARSLEVSITAEGPCGPVEGGGSTPGSGGFTITRKITAEPYKRYTVRLPVKALGPGEIVLTARARDGKDKDSMQHKLKVLRARPQEVAASYGTVLSGDASERIAFPEEMLPETGLVEVILSPSALGELGGSLAFMKDYPFECWEQKLSRAVLAGAFPKLAAWMPATVSWQDGAAVAEKTLAMAAEFQAPNGGMAFYTPKNEYVSPYLSAYTALAFDWLRESGHAPPVPVETRLHKYLREFLKRDGHSGSNDFAADVRSVALLALADSGKVSRADLERHWKHFAEMSVFGKANFLEALTKVADTATMRRKAVDDILSRTDRSGGSITFAAPDDSAPQFLLSSPARDSAAVLLAFLSARSAGPADLITPADIPVRLMRSISLARKNSDHWASTQGNVFAVMAALRYSKMYEPTPPDVSARVLLDQRYLGEANFNSRTAQPAHFEYRTRKEDRGRSGAVLVRKQGEGRLYYSRRLSYTPAGPVEPVNAGIEIHREYSVQRDGRWVLLENPMEIRTGELVRVDLFVSLPAERYFVVVEDPVPGGLEPVNRQLATASEVDAPGEEALFAENSFRGRYNDWRSYGTSRWSFYHKELRHDVARFYSERLGSGRYYLSYTAQAIAPGRFAAPPARAEEMYDPDVFGRTAPAQLDVKLSD